MTNAKYRQLVRF